LVIKEKNDFRKGPKQWDTNQKKKKRVTQQKKNEPKMPFGSPAEAARSAEDPQRGPGKERDLQPCSFAGSRRHQKCSSLKPPRRRSRRVLSFFRVSIDGDSVKSYQIAFGTWVYRTTNKEVGKIRTKARKVRTGSTPSTAEMSA
jgi:hypothetical protein